MPEGLSRSLARRLLIAAPALGLLVACNALTGVGDLGIGPCEGCDGVVGGEGGVDGGADAILPGTDGAKVDGQADDGSTPEGPGGILDPTFGIGGVVEVDLLPDPHAVAVRGDGRIVVVGAVSGDLAAVAFTSGGAVDTTFGVGGRVVRGNGTSSAGYAVAFDSQGRALVGGVSVVVVSVPTPFPYVVRIGASLVDLSFGNSGSWRGTGAGEIATGLVTAPGDSVVFTVTGNNDHTFWRLTSGGDPDATFGNNGRASVSVGAAAAGLVARADGFVSGGTGDSFAGRALAAAKVSLAGQPVVGFGTGGKATSKVGPNNTELGRAIAAQPDGKLLVAGDYDPNLANVKRVSAVTRLSAAGVADLAYGGTTGKVVIDLTEVGVGRETETSVRTIAVDAKGRALLVGTAFDKPLVGPGNRSRAWATRLRSDGVLDPLFGKQGTLLVGSATDQLEARGAALQADGKLVVVGVNNTTNKLFVARIVTTTP